MDFISVPRALHLPGGDQVNSRGQKLLRLVRQEGIPLGLEVLLRRAASPLVGSSRIHAAITRTTDSLYDLRTGFDTGSMLSQHEIGIRPADGREYVATPPRVWRRLMRKLPVNPATYTYVDLGCGKGRTLILAAQYGFRRVVGVDLSEKMLEIARRNLDKAACHTAEVIHANAATYSLPEDPVVLFIYNAFWRDVLEQIAKGVVSSLAVRPRPLYVVYWNPAFREVFDRLQPIEGDSEFEGPYPSRYVIYKSRLE